MIDRKALEALGGVGSIGFVMAAGALLGWWGGTWADRHWGTEPWGLVIGLLLGLGGAALECWHILKRFIDTKDPSAGRDETRRKE